MNNVNGMRYLKIAETYVEGYDEANNQLKAFIRGAVTAISTVAAVSEGVSSEEYTNLTKLVRSLYR